MKYLKHLILVLLIFFIESSSADLSSQGVKQKPTRQSSMEAFSGGDYEKAYCEFSELLKTYSKDPLYKYYSAVCLINLERNPEEAVALMQQALESNAAARPLPVEAMFYLGRARHLSGLYPEAIDSYTRYSDQVGKKAAKEQDVPDFIQQCMQERGALEKIAELPAEPVKEEVKPIVAVTSVAVVEIAENITSDKALPVKEDLPEEYSSIIEEALVFQFLGDSVNALVADQKQKIEMMPNDKKPASKAKIAEYELLAASYQKSADQKYSEAELAMNPDKQKQNQDEVMQVSLPITDTVDIFSYFEILEKPVTDPGVKVRINPEVPQGLIYRISK